MTPDIREKAERLAAEIFAIGLVSIDDYVDALASALSAEREAGREEERHKVSTLLAQAAKRKQTEVEYSAMLAAAANRRMKDPR